MRIKPFSNTPRKQLPSKPRFRGVFKDKPKTGSFTTIPIPVFKDGFGTRLEHYTQEDAKTSVNVYVNDDFSGNHATQWKEAQARFSDIFRLKVEFAKRAQLPQRVAVPNVEDLTWMIMRFYRPNPIAKLIPTRPDPVLENLLPLQSPSKPTSQSASVPPNKMPLGDFQKWLESTPA